jgi:hypothetical protein
MTMDLGGTILERGVSVSSWSELLDRAEPEEHVVQLYGGDDKLLARNVSRYLAEGFRKGDGMVLIATGEHADLILRHLNEEAVGVSQALDDRQLVVLDARATLNQFLVNGTPDQSLFKDVVGSVIQDVRTRSLSGRLRAFGEMVGLLWVEGRQPAAIRVEEYWNELLAGSQCSLFCAYPIDIFDSDSPTNGLEAVLGAHTHAYAGPKTMLSGPRAAR